MGLVTGSRSATRRSASNRAPLGCRWSRLDVYCKQARKEVGHELEDGCPADPGQRLSQGLRYTAVGPVDVTRSGWANLGGRALRRSGAACGGGPPREEQARQGARGRTADHHPGDRRGAGSAREPASGDRGRPQAQTAGKRPLVSAAAGIGVVAVGAVAFSIIRRSMQPDPSPRPPSVEVIPKP